MLKRKDIVFAAMLFIGTFVYTLHGEELLFIHFGAINQVWTLVKQKKTCHVMLGLLGLQKGMRIMRTFLIPSVCETPQGVKVELWIGRMLETIVHTGNHSGFLYERVDRKTPKLKELKPIFFKCLIKIQEGQSGIIPPDLSIPYAYGIHRSGRRRSVTNTWNLGFHRNDIDFFLFWKRTDLNLGRSINHLKMVNYYREISQSLSTILRFTGRHYTEDKET